jgi:hypothetical protein
MAKHKEFALIGLAVMMLAAVSAQATSHVRIVRLSYESGNVQMDRLQGQGLERAILNSPVLEGSRIVTGNDGLAEVEFENNSTVRVGEASEVKFRQLLMNDAGDKVNEVELVRGMMYFDTRSGKTDIYRVVAAGQTFTLRQNSLVRLVMNGDQVQAAALRGEAQFEENGQVVKLKKNDTVTVDGTNPAAYVLAKNVNKLPLDAWNNERAAYQDAYSYNNSGYGSKSMGGFGYSDLAYYGGFQYLPGYGTVWQPYGAASWMGWDPYASGAWAFSPGFGYVWASAYPWGWLPYHYGSWIYVPTGGWFWSPGNSFNGGGVVRNWQGNAPVTNGPAGYRPPRPPAANPNSAGATVLVGQIGRMPAYLPGGPVPPDFRSVIIDHSSIRGMTAPAGGGSTGGAASAASRGTRAANSRSIMGTASTGSTFVTPREQAASNGRFGQSPAARNNAGGHVFVTPQPAASMASPGWGSDGFGSASGSFGRGSGASGSAPMHSSGGTGGHSGGTTGGSHASGSANPK